jgi:AcrR family transcriptional regulator
MRAPRMSAAERREQILDAAVTEFARTGLHGTSTETIAARAGVSQPYLFRLFGTKRELFIAAAGRMFDRVSETFRVAAESAPGDPLQAMGAAYKRLMEHREELLLQLQTYAACDDDGIRGEVRRRYSDLFEQVVVLSGAERDVIRDFFAVGMLLNVTLATGTESLLEGEWMSHCFEAHE